MQTFYAHGKLLLTGEYFVLDGAKALAVPTRLGQKMTVSQKQVLPDELHWNSIDYQGNEWFNTVFNAQKKQEGKRDENEVVDRLEQIFEAIRMYSREAYDQLWQQRLELQLEFPRNWGLGSSSTLISLLSQWLELNPYQLLEDSFGGSGYDLACATANGPIVYQRQMDEAPLVTPLDWQPGYRDQLFFAYQGKKQNSREGISHYRELCGAQITLIDEATALTEAFMAASNFSEACKVATAHETFVSTVLQMEKVQDQRFADFPGVVKSLGAWGGDFVLVFSPWPAMKTKAYFNEKGCPDVLAYTEMI